MAAAHTVGAITHAVPKRHAMIGAGRHKATWTRAHRTATATATATAPATATATAPATTPTSVR